MRPSPAAKLNSRTSSWIVLVIAVVLCAPAFVAAQFAGAAAFPAKVRKDKTKREKNGQGRLDAPTADGSPTLRETSAWLSVTLTEYGGSTWDRFPESVANVEIDNACNFDWTRVVNPGKDAQYTRYSVPLGAVTRISLDPQNRDGNHWIDLDFSTGNIAAIAEDDYVGKYKVSSTTSTAEAWIVISREPAPKPGALLPESSEQVAPRIQRALQHAIDLCRGTFQVQSGLTQDSNARVDSWLAKSSAAAGGKQQQLPAEAAGQPVGQQPIVQQSRGGAEPAFTVYVADGSGKTVPVTGVTISDSVRKLSANLRQGSKLSYDEPSGVLTYSESNGFLTVHARLSDLDPLNVVFGSMQPWGLGNYYAASLNCKDQQNCVWLDSGSRTSFITLSCDPPNVQAFRLFLRFIFADRPNFKLTTMKSPQGTDAQSSPSESTDEQANEAAQHQQEIQDKIDRLNQEIQQLESDANDADRNADNLATNSNCTGGFGAYAQIAQQGCENINSIGVAKFRSEAARDRNQADDDRAEIARLQGEEVQEAPHRDASFGGALAQQMQQNPQPSIQDTANQQAANMVALGAANDAARAQAAAARREQQEAEQQREEAEARQTNAPAGQAVSSTSSSPPSNGSSSACGSFPAFVTASSSAFTQFQRAGLTQYTGSLIFNVPAGFRSDGAEIDNLAQGTSFATNSGTVIPIGDTVAGPANSSAFIILDDGTDQMTYKASFPTAVPHPFSITLRPDGVCGPRPATGGAGVPD